MRLVVLALTPFLCGCGSIMDLVDAPYVPQPIHVFDQAQYEADLTECRTAGVAFKPTFSVSGAISRTIRGATSNSSLIPVSPLVPVYGAAGGAVGAASDGFDVMSAQHENVFRNCLHDELRRDGSAVLVDPRD